LTISSTNGCTANHSPARARHRLKERWPGGI
jgi:hypothetical protein